MTPKNRIYSHIPGIELVQAKDGELYILEGNLRIPSGASYPLTASTTTATTTIVKNGEEKNDIFE